MLYQARLPPDPQQKGELMDDKTKEIIEAKWREVIGKQIGYQDYRELKSAYKKEKMNDNYIL